MEPGSALLAVSAFSVLGVACGTFTGLLPGVHVNNIALLIVALLPGLLPPLAGALGSDGAILALACLLAAAGVAHSIVALLPAVFLGAPEAGTALSVLPGHRLLARGRGYEAVALGARGAFLGALLALPLLLPFRLLLGPPVDAYRRLQPLLPLFLLVLAAILLASEGRRSDPRRARRQRAWAVVLLLLAGLLGLLVLRPGFLQGVWAPLPIGGDSLVLFPLFTGLFGLPTLLLSLRRGKRLPPQDSAPAPELPEWRRTRGLWSGTLAGAAVSWFPGLGGANATVIAQLLAGGEPSRGDPDADREFLVAVGAAGTSTTVFTLAALFVILRSRSGVAAAVDAVLGGADAWRHASIVPPSLAAVLVAVVVASSLAYGVTLWLARPFARAAGRVRYDRLAGSVVLALVLAAFLVTGLIGLAVLGTATALGLVPPVVGVRRVHLMGCLLLPLVLGA